MLARGTFIHANPSDPIHYGKGGVTVYEGVLHLEPDFEVVGEAGDGQEGLNKARLLHPDLVLLDLMMPRMDGVATARAIQKHLRR